ncbi:hypothetical protein QW180_01030 [Vibrio sinaloensis]|nr:hypothetical protein [Vibrio sinaloensis]
MELALERLEFEQVVFVRPGPLVGLREQPRADERITQAIFESTPPFDVGAVS